MTETDKKKDTGLSRTTSSRASYTCLKLKKMVAASFMITESIEASNPLRQAIRVTIADLMTEAYKTMGQHGSLSPQPRLALVNRLDAYLGQLETLVVIGDIAEESGEILKQEASSIREMLLGDGDFSGAYKMLIPSRFFEVDGGQYGGDVTMSTEMNGSAPDKGHNDIRHKGRVLDKVIVGGSGSKKDVMNLIGQRLGEAGTGRRILIKKSFEVGKEYSVKDVMAVIPGVSEKTVQRELLAMVGANEIGKRGERRWSRYFLLSGSEIVR